MNYSGIHQFINRIVSGCLIMALLMNTIGCYNHRQISSISGAKKSTTEAMEQTLSSLPVGKTVKVELRNGKSVTGRVVAYRDSVLKIKGQQLGRKTEDINKSEIDAVYEKKISAGKTAGAVLGGVGGVIVILGGVFLYVLSKAGPGAFGT